MPLSTARTSRTLPKTKVIFNPAANKGSCGKAWPDIKAELAAVLHAVDAEATRRPGDGSRIARAAFEDGCRRFIAVGGDGTLNEVVNGLVEDDHLLDPGVTFAQIPAGTSNAVSLALGQSGRGANATALISINRSGCTPARPGRGTIRPTSSARTS